MKKEFFNDAPIVIKKFLGYFQTIKGKSRKTVEEYFLDLRTFFRYMKRKRGKVSAEIEFEKIDICDIDINFIKTISLIDVFEFMNYLSTERKNSEAARARKASSLRVFFKYLTDKTNELSENPLTELETPKLKKTVPKFLSLEQSQTLLKTISENGEIGRAHV